MATTTVYTTIVHYYYYYYYYYCYCCCCCCCCYYYYCDLFNIQGPALGVRYMKWLSICTCQEERPIARAPSSVP